MKLKTLCGLIGGEVISSCENLERDVLHGFSSDLMSDVLTYAEADWSNSVLLTGLTNIQVIRTAELLDLKAIIFLRGKHPSKEVIEMAEDDGVVLIRTERTMYTTTGILHQNGLKGIDE
jgi:hypothetical protein